MVEGTLEFALTERTSVDGSFYWMDATGTIFMADVLDRVGLLGATVEETMEILDPKEEKVKDDT